MVGGGEATLWLIGLVLFLAAASYAGAGGLYLLYRSGKAASFFYDLFFVTHLLSPLPSTPLCPMLPVLAFSTVLYWL